MPIAFVDLFARLRRERPLVHNLTNDVVTSLTANALLAVGASPAMVVAREEVAEFVTHAAALVINIGTLTASSLDAMLVAAEAAARARVPWVLDPVAVGATAFRREAVARLLEHHPTVIRGNASEVLALATGERHGRGVDAEAGTDADAARALARRTGSVVAATGPIDVITDGERTLRIHNGHPSLTRLTGAGCTATALTGALLGSGAPPLEAAAAALVLLGVAGERAADERPGTFAVRLLDELGTLTPEALATAARCEA